MGFTGEIHTSIDINAPPQVVWAVLSDLPKHSEWDPFLEPEGELVQGQRIKVKVKLEGRKDAFYSCKLLTGELGAAPPGRTGGSTAANVTASCVCHVRCNPGAPHPQHPPSTNPRLPRRLQSNLTRSSSGGAACPSLACLLSLTTSASSPRPRARPAAGL